MLESALCNGSVDFVVLTKALLRLCVHNIHNYRLMYNGALHTYINVCTYMQPRWNALHLLCSWSGNGPDFLKYVNGPYEQMLAYAL